MSMGFWPALGLAAVIGLGAHLAASPVLADQLKMVKIEVESPGQLKKLRAMGLDIAAIRKGREVRGPRGVPFTSLSVEAVVSPNDETALERGGFSWSDLPGKGPRKKIGADDYEVYDSFDAPRTGIRAQLKQIETDHPQLVQSKTIGKSHQNRPIIALGLTNEKNKGDKPQVLFHATTHAREWVATQMAMRLSHYLVDNYGSDTRVTKLLDTTEIWIIPVVNPDGYQYTFTNERLWRKNLRDNDGNKVIDLSDGVDLNRNYDSHWGYDNEGSEANVDGETYRGPAPNSEPETKALVGFMQANDFKFAVSYHTYGNLILYPWGWQVSTESLDNEIFTAQAGVDNNAAIHDSLLGQDYDPGVGADLYTTNGEFTDWAYEVLGVPSYTVELTFGADADGISNFYGFEFPDDEAMVNQVFEDNLEFALSLTESAQDPADPVSPVGMPAQVAVHEPFTASWGPEQEIVVVALRGTDLELSASGAVAVGPFEEKFGRFYNTGPGVYYSRYVATIQNPGAGSTVDYEIEADGESLGQFSYLVKSDTGNGVLVFSAEDYTGANPTYADQSGPNYLHYYTDALTDIGVDADVYDVEVEGSTRRVGGFGNYDTVIWYTGDDYAARDEEDLDSQRVQVLALRDYLNYSDGRLFATGQDLGWLAAVAAFYSDDFFQYYLGAYIDLDTGGIDPVSTLPNPVLGVGGDPALGDLDAELQGGDGANNQCCSSELLVTSHFVPHFDHHAAASYVRLGGPFSPFSGDYYAYTDLADQAFKRLGGTFTLPSGPSGTIKMNLWMSYDIETDWDYAFIEVREVGTDDWTTLPDENGATTTGTGQSCPSGWVDQLHPALANYMDEACNPTGATGSWNALTGNSSGWQPIEVDLSAYAGQTVEIYISYATDWATQGLGVFVDDVEIAGQPLEDFETGSSFLTASSAPGSAQPANNWTIQTDAELPVAAAVRTPYSVYLGFGFEAIDTAATRAQVMEQVLDYLGGSTSLTSASAAP